MPFFFPIWLVCWHFSLTISSFLFVFLLSFQVTIKISDVYRLMTHTKNTDCFFLMFFAVVQLFWEFHLLSDHPGVYYIVFENTASSDLYNSLGGRQLDRQTNIQEDRQICRQAGFIDLWVDSLTNLLNYYHRRCSLWTRWYEGPETHNTLNYSLLYQKM